MPNYSLADWPGRGYLSIVEDVISLCSRDLKIIDPIPHVFLRDDVNGNMYWPVDIGGVCDPEGIHIYLRLDLSSRELARATAHECRHAYHKQKKLTLPEASYERDCHIYELEFLNQLGWPDDRSLVRDLATANDKAKVAEQARIDKLRDDLRYQETLHASLRTQRGASWMQKDTLARSIVELRSEVKKVEGRLMTR